jgi:hypothetical protein
MTLPSSKFQMSEERPLCDFLTAIQSIDPIFAGIHEMTINKTKKTEVDELEREDPVH